MSPCIHVLNIIKYKGLEIKSRIEFKTAELRVSHRRPLERGTLCDERGNHNIPCIDAEHFVCILAVDNLEILDTAVHECWALSRRELEPVGRMDAHNVVRQGHQVLKEREMESRAVRRICHVGGEFHS